MARDSRRGFLQKAGATGLAAAASHFSAPFVSAQSASSAAYPLYLDSRRTISTIDRNIFGSFLEHLGRAIYEGIYDPSSKFSDANGFRKDILEEIRKMNVPIVRYPGGNFVSGYHWLDGVGPKQDRPRVLEKAWNSLETNQFGLNEFMAWCKLVGTQPLLGMNFGTASAESAAALLEYCNVDKGTKWSDLRRKHGIEQPYNVTHWCLGNEMDGPWQIGHMSATEYGEKAADAGRQMRYVDPSPALQLIACGSSGPFMPTYLIWDREVLEQCYEYVDAISLHRYFGNDAETGGGGDSTKYLALNLSMEQQINEVAAVCDYVRGRKRSPKKLWLSFDEWNVWYRERTGKAVNGNRQPAPHLLEEIYNLEDALLVGGLINSLIRNSNRVRIACLAQLVNVIAPIMTNADGFYHQTIYHPYFWALQHARGTALDVHAEPGPAYEVAPFGQVPYVDVAATWNNEDKSTTLLLLNRDLAKPHPVEVHWGDIPAGKLLASSVITGTDLKAVNSFASPNKIAPQDAEKPVTSAGVTKLELPPRSYSLYRWGA